jgi:Cd2+/Zn2+-exporting ATPase
MHSLAQAVVRLAQQRNLNLPEAGELQSVTGKVVISTVNGKQVKIGNLKLFSESNSSAIPEVIAEQVRALEAEGKSTMLVMMNNRLLGILRLSDQPRAEAKSTLAKLAELGIKKKIMLTGDNERVAASIAKEVGLDEYRAGLMPENKVTTILAVRHCRHRHRDHLSRGQHARGRG